MDATLSARKKMARKNIYLRQRSATLSVISYQLSVISYQLSVISYQSPITFSPITNHQSPITFSPITFSPITNSYYKLSIIFPVPIR
jgi:hypothetical protein